MLVLLPANWTSLRSRLELKTVSRRLAEALGRPVDLRDYKGWHLQMYQTCGDWRSWMWETVLGRDYETRQPHFDAFVVPPDSIDHVSAEIVNLALNKNRPVLGFNQDMALLQINSLRQCDEDTGGGWAACGIPFTGAQAHA